MMTSPKKSRLLILTFSAIALIATGCASGDTEATDSAKQFTEQAASESTASSTVSSSKTSTSSSATKPKDKEPSNAIKLNKDGLQEVSSSNFSGGSVVRFGFHVDGSYAECVKGDGYVSCSGKPDSSVPDVENPPFSGRPNEVQISSTAVHYNIGEGGPPGASELEPGQWVRLGVAECGMEDSSALVCETDGAALEISGKDRAIRTSGNITSDFSFYDQSSQEAKDNGTTYGKSQDVLVKAPMMCGAATGPRLAEVVKGEMTCEEAMEVLDHYESVRSTEGGGNTLATSFDGWSCSSPTAARSQELHASAVCDNTGRGLRVQAPS